MNQVDHTKNASCLFSWFSRICGVAALIVGMLLLIAIINLFISILQPGIPNCWYSIFQNNWLMVIFKTLAGFAGNQIRLLHILNIVDIAILFLVGMMYVETMYLGLHAITERKKLIWLIIGTTQPFTGIILFIATKSAGRTGVIGAVLILSFVLLRSNIFKRVIAYLGIAAGFLLAVGDVSVGLIPPLVPPLMIMATLFGIGYVLLMAWFFLIAYNLFNCG